jgi:hypothetical protein
VKRFAHFCCLHSLLLAAAAGESEGGGGYSSSAWTSVSMALFENSGGDPRLAGGNRAAQPWASARRHSKALYAYRQKDISALFTF